MMMLVIPALFSSACNSIANTLWKIQFSKAPLQTSSMIEFVKSVLCWRIIGGVVFYGVSMLLFFYLLSHYRLSQVVPFLATTYVFNFIVAVFFLKETVVVSQLAGIALIVVGVIVSNI